MKSKDEQRHDAIVRRLERDLEAQGQIVFSFIEYSNNGYNGEVDVFAIKDTMPPRYTFYEVKCTDCHKRRLKAKYQYERFLRAYDLNRREVQGILVTSTRTRRL